MFYPTKLDPVPAFTEHPCVISDLTVRRLSDDGITTLKVSRTFFPSEQALTALSLITSQAVYPPPVNLFRSFAPPVSHDRTYLESSSHGSGAPSAPSPADIPYTSGYNDDLQSLSTQLETVHSLGASGSLIEFGEVDDELYRSSAQSGKSNS
jgi:hypothetical protein